jgi:hypothetical protein
MGFIKCQWSASRSTMTICLRRRGTCDLIAAIDQKMNDVGRVSTGRWWRCLATRRCTKALARAAWPEATEHKKRWVQGQIREGTMADLPRRSALSGKWWFGPAVMASPYKWKRMAAVLLSDFPAAVKGRT